MPGSLHYDSEDSSSSAIGMMKQVVTPSIKGKEPSRGSEMDSAYGSGTESLQLHASRRSLTAPSSVRGSITNTNSRSGGPSSIPPPIDNSQIYAFCEEHVLVLEGANLRLGLRRDWKIIVPNEMLQRYFQGPQDLPGSVT